MSILNDFGRELKPCLYIFQIFGLQFFSLNELSSDEGVSWRTRWKKAIYFVLYLSYLIVQNLMSIKDVHKLNCDESVNCIIIHVVEYGTLLAFFAAEIITVILSYMSTEHHKKIFVNLSESHRLFTGQLYRKLKYRSFKLKVLPKLSVFGILFFVAVYLIKQDRQEHLQIEVSNFNITATLTVAFAGLQFVFYAELINFYLEHLEGSIRNLQKKIEIYNLSKRISIKLRSSVGCEEEVLRKMLVVRKIYGIIWYTTYLVNLCLGKILLMLLTLTVIGCTAFGYKIFLVVVSGQKIEKAICESSE